MTDESIMKLCWALVHSRQPEDVQRGLDMLEGYVGVRYLQAQRTEMFYLLAVGYYRIGELMFSWQCLDQCLDSSYYNFDWWKYSLSSGNLGLTWS